MMKSFRVRKQPFFRAMFVVYLASLATGCMTTKRLNRSEPVQVVVEEGDTLNSIAKQLDTDWKSIVQQNKSALRSGLRVGLVLNVQPGPAAEIKKAVEPVSGAADEHAEEDEGDDDGKFLSRSKKGLLFGGGGSDEASVGDFIFPVEGQITSYFGKRGRRMHKGIDISANVGTPIVAAADGEVIFSGRRRGYGSTIVVEHNGWMTLYAHCSKLIARVGDVVKQGDFIAKVGRTGNARGAHLHFEIRDADNNAVDPVPMLRHKTIAGQFRGAGELLASFVGFSPMVD